MHRKVFNLSKCDVYVVARRIPQSRFDGNRACCRNNTSSLLGTKISWIWNMEINTTSYQQQEFKCFFVLPLGEDLLVFVWIHLLWNYESNHFPDYWAQLIIKKGFPNFLVMKRILMDKCFADFFYISLKHHFHLLLYKKLNCIGCMASDPVFTSFILFSWNQYCCQRKVRFISQWCN